MPAIEPLNQSESDRASRVALAMHEAWRAWLESLPEAERTASGLSRALGVDRTTCQRLVHAVRGPFVGAGMLAQVPGVPGLRAVLAAGRGRVPAGIGDAAGAAVEGFAALIDEIAGSQSRLTRRLDASAMAPEVAGAGGGGVGGVGGEEDVSDRQRLFEAAARVTGRWSDLWTAVYLFRPDAARERMRVPRLYGLLGHRATPDAVPLVIQNYASIAVEPGAAPGAAAAEVLSGPIARFSSDLSALRPVPQSSGLLVQRVDADQRGGEPIDLVLGSVGENPHPRLREERVANLWAFVHFPARALLVDAYLPVSEARASIPSVGAHLWAPEFDLDARPSWRTRFPVSPRLELLGRGIEGCDSGLSPRHRELTEFLFRSEGAEATEYVGYRLAVPFPLWRAGYCITFDFA